jgi:serine/threonine protein kinase
MLPRPSAPASPVSSEQFLKGLTDSGLLSAGEVQAVLSGISFSRRHDVRQLAAEFVKQGKLTRYQATMLFQGRSRGLVLGNYALLDKLGQGGMGMVFKALDRRSNRTVAVKVLPPGRMEEPETLQRFQREVRAVVQLDHPNIVAALASGVVDGVHFFVMEYVDGSDLSRLVKAKGPLPVAQAVHCTLQAARGLAHAHAAGIVHRDIKPSNLLLSTQSGAVKILDLGLARFDSGNTPEAAAADDLTRTGSIMGTADYMAPEQAANIRRADHRADIYSLGCTLYYLLAGQPLYSGETAIEKLLAHREQPVPALRALRPEVPAALDDLFRRMVAKRPEDRPQSMAEAVSALEKCAPAGRASRPPSLLARAMNFEPALPPGAADTPLEIPQFTTIEPRTRRFARGRGRWALAGAVVLLLLICWSLLRPSSRPEAGKPSDSTQLASNAAPVEPGWVSLFNGKDLTGWQVHSGRPDVWRVEGGVLGYQNPPNEGWLVTTKSYEDFDLRLEYRVFAEADSGVGIRLQPPGSPANVLQVQIRDEPQQPAPARDAHLVTGSLVFLVAGAKPALRPLGQWNEMRIGARGKHFTVEVNSVRTLDTDLETTRDLIRTVRADLHPLSGPIGLQCFRGRADFRNIYIKPVAR